MNSRNTTKMVEHKFVLFATFKAFWTLVTLLIKLIHILLKLKYIQDQNYALCWPLCCESEAILFKRFIPRYWAAVFIWENFHPGYRDLGRKNRDLGNRVNPASHMNTSTFLQRKERRGEISDTEPARLTGPIWRGPEISVTGMKIFSYEHSSPVTGMKLFKQNSFALTK